MLAKHFMVSDDGNLYDTRRTNWSARPLRYDYATIYRTVQRSTICLRAAIRQGYAWPGGYELFGITSDGECLCTKCMRANYYQIAYSARHEINDGWRIIGIECAANTDAKTICAHCNRVIVEGYENEE